MELTRNERMGMVALPLMGALFLILAFQAWVLPAHEEVKYIAATAPTATPETLGTIPVGVPVIIEAEEGELVWKAYTTVTTTTPRP